MQYRIWSYLEHIKYMRLLIVTLCFRPWWALLCCESVFLILWNTGFPSLHWSPWHPNYRTIEFPQTWILTPYHWPQNFSLTPYFPSVCVCVCVCACLCVYDKDRKNSCSVSWLCFLILFHQFLLFSITMIWLILISGRVSLFSFCFIFFHKMSSY